MECVASTVIVADDLRFAEAEEVDVAVAIYPVIGLPPLLERCSKAYTDRSWTRYGGNNISYRSRCRK